MGPVRERQTAVNRVPNGLPQQLRTDVERAGYYPELICDVLDVALAGEEVRHFLVHPETTFDHDSVRRHVTVLVLTERRLIIVHAADHSQDPHGNEEVATATSESITLGFVRGIMLTHVVSDPRNYVPGSLGREVTLTLGWGTVSRIDLLPATCGDPACEADHGFEGSIASDDLVLRISADADGAQSLGQAKDFAAALSARIGH